MINQTTSTFVLRADPELNKDLKNCKIIPFIHKISSNCISEIGKHYLLRIMNYGLSKKPHVRRHYTITNCMTQ